ncbi:MAG TPA: PDZ domain-containing protein [Candidatus Sulfotelmatobacter sp.]|nr:PDZ domain-containing protein [Candidatus Sulfotelmatobacter sp.]
MNAKQVLTVLGLGALTVALVALPGTSAHKQAPSTSSSVSCSQVQQDAARLANDARMALVQSNVADIVTGDDDDVQVFVSSDHGWLGAGISEVTADKVKEFKLPAERGVLLSKIVPDSPAAKAGLKENDVVTEINGQRVEGTEQFRRMIREIPAGRTAQFTVWRDGRAQSVSVTIGKSAPQYNTSVVSPGTFAFHIPEMPELNDLMESGPWFAGRPRLGIDAEDLQGEFGTFFGAPDGEGVLVRDVFSDSPAAKAGLKVGDVITSVDGEKIRSVGDLREKLVEKKDQKTVKLGLLRNKAPLSLSVEIPPPAKRHERHNSVRTNI